MKEQQKQQPEQEYHPQRQEEQRLDSPPDDETFSFIIRKFYFPLIRRYHNHITIAWVFVLIICGKH